MTNWIDIDDEVPSAEGNYLCALYDNREPRIRTFKELAPSQPPRFISNGRRCYNVTHWMRLPLLPENCKKIKKRSK